MRRFESADAREERFNEMVRNKQESTWEDFQDELQVEQFIYEWDPENLLRDMVQRIAIARAELSKIPRAKSTISCAGCNGTGGTGPNPWVPCTTCGGSGMLVKINAGATEKRYDLLKKLYERLEQDIDHHVEKSAQIRTESIFS